MAFIIYLPFSDTISGPPESPSHESLALLLSPAQMWKLNHKCVKCNLKINSIFISRIPLNPARIIVTTLFIRYNLDLCLLEC